MIRISECHRRIYDHFHGTPSCQSHFFKKVQEDEYAAYYTAMYLLQDSTEALLAHRIQDFSSTPLAAYIELWGVMQAINIQQDSIRKLYVILTGNPFPAFQGKWKEIRDLRVLCAGHPADKGEIRKQPAERTFAGRSFGGYDVLNLETWSENAKKIAHPQIALGKLIDDYAEEAAGFLEAAEQEMKKRWPYNTQPDSGGDGIPRLRADVRYKEGAK